MVGMTKIVKLSLSMVCILICCTITFSINGCSESASNPGYGAIDTSGNGNDPISLWILEGPVTYSAGTIQAVNTSDQISDSTTARCTLRETVDFGDVAGVIFTWREQIGGDAEYEFFVGGSTSRMMSIHYEQIPGDVQRALLAFQGSFNQPLYSRFEFRLPSASSVQIQNYQAKGE